MPHSIYHGKASGKGLVATTFGFQKTAVDVIRLFGKKVAHFFDKLTATAEDGLGS